MNSRKKTVIPFLLAACLTTGLQFSSLAQAAPNECQESGGMCMMPPGHERPEHPMQEGPGMHEKEATPPFLRGIELSEAQQDKIFSIMHQQAPLLREQAKAAHKAHEALRTLAASGQYDEAKARTLADSGARAMAEIALLHARAEQQIRALLTPEQRKRADAIRAKFDANFESHPRHEGGFRPSVERHPRAQPTMPMM